MCQLLGMDCNMPTDICFSFEGFSRRGGETDDESDGFGIAFFEGRGVRTFLDAQAAADSPVADLVRRYPIRSRNTIAHIRKATSGSVALENCHPFVRELWGRYWVFAHNGELKGFHPEGLDRFQPVGDTDSERAFCYIMESLRGQFPKGTPPLPALYAFLEHLSAEIARFGVFNYLLSCGDWLIARADTHLHYVLRRAPFAAAHLVDEDVTVKLNELTDEDGRVAIVATQPLTDNEDWMAFAPGQIVLFRDGRVHCPD